MIHDFYDGLVFDPDVFLAIPSGFLQIINFNNFQLRIQEESHHLNTSSGMIKLKKAPEIKNHSDDFPITYW